MVMQFTENTIKESIKPILIKAFATWCPHCAVMKPLVEELEGELGKKYTFTEFDVDKYPELTKQFNVSSLPTFIFIKNKAEVARTTGEMSKEELKGNIEKHLG
jgi:thioredoxin 1